MLCFMFDSFRCNYNYIIITRGKNIILKHIIIIVIYLYIRTITNKKIKILYSYISNLLLL